MVFSPDSNEEVRSWEQRFGQNFRDKWVEWLKWPDGADGTDPAIAGGATGAPEDKDQQSSSHLLLLLSMGFDGIHRLEDRAPWWLEQSESWKPESGE